MNARDQWATALFVAIVTTALLAGTSAMAEVIFVVDAPNDGNILRRSVVPGDGTIWPTTVSQTFDLSTDGDTAAGLSGTLYVSGTSWFEGQRLSSAYPPPPEETRPARYNQVFNGDYAGDLGGNSGQTAIWTATGYMPDTQVEVYTFYTYQGNYADEAPYSVNGAEPVVVNMKTPPLDDLVLNDGSMDRNFEFLGTYAADASGQLQVILADQNNWAPVDAMAFRTVASPFDPTDFDQDEDSDLADINMLTAAADLSVGVPAALAGPEFDLTGDETVDGADLDKWLTDAAVINGFASPYLKGDANVDGDVDVWAFDGSGDAQVLSSNLGAMSGMVWGDGDFNGDGDVDVWAFDGSGDAQQLSSNLGSSSDVGPDAAAGTAEAIYFPSTGELFFDIGSGVGVVGIMAEGMKHGEVNGGSIFGTPAQNSNDVLAYFATSGLPTGEDSVGIVLPTGLTIDEITFSYTPVGGATTVVPVTIPVPEPSTIAMLAVAGLIGVSRRRRRA